MKNATKHAEELKALIKKAPKDPKPDPKPSFEPLAALVRGAMSYDVPDARADEAMSRIEREFVDLNELRVATDLEIQELLGARYPAIEQRVAMITQTLNLIFEREHTLNLERLKTLKKTEARQFLRDLPNLSPFVEAYVMLYGLDTPALPMDESMLALLKDAAILDPAATVVEAQKFAEHHLKSDEYHESYRALRRLAGDESRTKRKPAKA